MPTIDEELIQNAKAVFHGKVEHSEDVKFSKNAEVNGQITINSAKDLKTKDGTSFGGVGENPTFNSVTTNKLYINTETKSGYNRQHYYLYLPTDKTNIGGASFAYHISITQPNGNKNELFEIVQDTDDIHLLIKDPSNSVNKFKIGIDTTKAYLQYKMGNVTYNYTFPNKSGTIALVEDLNTKQ